MKVVGVDLGGTNARVGLVEDRSLGKVVTTSLCVDGSEAEICNQLYSIIDMFADQDITGLGIGVPSVVDVKNGIVYDVQNIPSWKKVHLKKRLEDRYQFPVHVNNDANCFAVGEKHFGKGQGYKNIVGLIVGTGMGAGLILNNRLYEGTHCGAGEFGMVPYNNEIFEAFSSGQFFQRQYKTRGEDLFQEAINGNRQAIRAYQEFGEHLGHAIEMILFTIDPEIIILGGSVSKSYKLFKDSMWNVIRTFPYTCTRDDIKIEVSEVDNIAVLGAAALCYEEMAW
jgi:glucokinase